MNLIRQNIEYDLREFYSTNKGYFECMRTSRDQKYYENILKVLERSNISLKSKKVLDVGSGTGELVTVLKNMYLQPFFSVGLDISFIGLKMQTIEFAINGNAEELPFRTDSFDIVFTTDVLEHVVRPYYVLQEMYRVVKSGGYLVIRTQNYRCPVLSQKPVNGLIKFLRDLLSSQKRTLDTTEALVPDLSPDCIGGDRDAVSMIFADAFRNTCRQLEGEIVVYETWAGMGWRFPILRILNKIPIVKHLGGTCTILYRKGKAALNK